MYIYIVYCLYSVCILFIYTYCILYMLIYCICVTWTETYFGQNKSLRMIHKPILANHGRKIGSKQLKANQRHHQNGQSMIPSGKLTQTLNMTNFQWKLIFQPLSGRVYVNLLEGITYMMDNKKCSRPPTRYDFSHENLHFCW